MRLIYIAFFLATGFMLFSNNFKFKPGQPEVRAGFSLKTVDMPAGYTLYSDATSDEETGKKKRKKIITNNNPFSDLDFSWFKEKYRAEKLLISIGVISMAIGTPFLLVGLLNYLVPFVEQSTLGETAYIAFMGVGSGVIGVGMTLTIVGGARLGYLKKKSKGPAVTLYFGFR